MHSEGDDGRPGAVLCTRGLNLFWLLGDTPDPWHVLQQGPWFLRVFLQSADASNLLLRTDPHFVALTIVLQSWTATRPGRSRPSSFGVPGRIGSTFVGVYPVKCGGRGCQVN